MLRDSDLRGEVLRSDLANQARARFRLVQDYLSRRVIKLRGEGLNIGYYGFVC